MKAARQYGTLFWFGVLIWLYCAISFGSFVLINEGRLARYTPLVASHGALVMGWMTLLAVQAKLASIGRFSLHRTLGKLSAILVAAMVVVSIVVLWNFYLEFDRRGTIAADTLILANFLLLYALGLAAARRRVIDWHMRFMLMAAISMLGPAHGRSVPALSLPLEIAAAFTIGFLVLLPIAFDLLTIRKVHRATLVAMGISIAFFVAQLASFILLEGF
jgi:hypothetical protein